MHNTYPHFRGDTRATATTKRLYIEINWNHEQHDSQKQLSLSIYSKSSRVLDINILLHRNELKWALKEVAACSGDDAPAAVAWSVELGRERADLAKCQLTAHSGAAGEEREFNFENVRTDNIFLRSRDDDTKKLL